MSKVYNGSIKKMLDIGGNTGKWAIASARFVKDLEITIMDLPGQLEVAREKVKQAGLEDRFIFIPPICWMKKQFSERVLTPSG